jgi:uncharacterized protein
MTADDLSAPLGQDLKRRRRFPVAISRALPQAVGAALAIFLGVFVLWAIMSDDPFGGEPMVAVPIDLHAAMAPKKPAMAGGPEAASVTSGPGRYDVRAAAVR